MRRSAAWWTFWSAAALLAYALFGFPLYTLWRGLVARRPVRATPISPSLSFIIAAYNEADVIVAKLQNTLALEYPPEQLEIIVASDGSDDGTDQLVAALADDRIRLLSLPRQGKNSALNAAVAQANGEILVFSDADSMLVPDALRHLLAPFADAKVGGVGGDYRYAAQAAEGIGERTYWNYDRRLKALQSQAGSISNTTGQIFAVRRELFEAVPPGVTDDAFISRTVLQRHRRVVFAPEAIAYGPVADDAGEFRRKVRVSTRGLNGIWQQRSLLNPFRYGWLSWQLFSHKVLRRLLALPLFALFASSLFLWRTAPFYRLVALAQLLFHGLALFGYLLQRKQARKVKLASLARHFDMVNLAALIGAINVMRGERYDVWSAERAGNIGQAQDHMENGA